MDLAFCRESRRRRLAVCEIAIRGLVHSAEFKVGFPFSTDLTLFDPAKVQLAGQYALLENLYTPLLRQTGDGRVVSGIASQYYWIDNEIEFQIRDNLVDSGQNAITVEDVLFSLMRLLILGTSTHGDLRKLISCEHLPKSPSDSCSGMRIVDGRLRIRPTIKDPAIFENFTSIDFSIVPRRSVSPSRLEDLNLSITSGPYSLRE